MENEKHSKRSSLSESNFAGIEFREFCGFRLILRKLVPDKIVNKLPIREIRKI